MKKFTVAQQAAAFKVTVEQIKAQHLKNAADCEKAAAKADAAVKLIGGHTGAQWRAMARNHRGIAAHDVNALYPMETV